MLNRFAFLLAAVAAVSSAQYLETTITLPDSSAPYGLCYNPANDKVYCANSNNNSVTVIDGATNEVIRTVPVGLCPVSFCYNPVNNLVYCESYGSAELYCIDGATDSVVAVVPGVGSSWEVCWNPVNNTLFTAYCGFPSGVVVTSCTLNLPVDTVVTEPYPFRLCHNPTANKVYCGVSDSLVAVIDGQTHELIRYVRVGAAPQGLLSIPGRNKVYCANQGNDFSVIDGASNNVVATVRVEGILNTAVCNARADRVYAGVVDRDSIVVVDCVADTVVAMVPAGDNPLAICYAPGGDKVYCANHCADGSVTVLDCATNTVAATVGVGGYPVAVCNNPRRNRVYVANMTSSTVSVIRDTTAGVEEFAGGSGPGLAPAAPTVVRGQLVLSSAFCNLTSDFILVDASGRRVMTLRPGANDVSRLAPGVYFVREAPAAAARRVVIAR